MARKLRLGDDIDDYCSRCRRISGHAVMGMVEDEVRRVRCSSCASEHAYRKGKLPASRRKDSTQALFDQVLGSRSRDDG